MNGVLNIYKEKGCTSFWVVSRLRRLTGEKKAGHAGTLDPDATGVLPVCLGKSTKLVDWLSDTDKEYRARMVFGASTDTQDISGKVLEEISPEEARSRLACKENIIRAAEGFVGEIKQLPPMYSALKVGGVKLVDAAREGLEIERAPRTINIYSISDMEVSEDLLSFSFTVSCSKGTYIRTLCSDIGQALNVPAALAKLERTRACGFGLEDCYTLSEAEEYYNEGKLESLLIPPDKMLVRFDALTVKDEALKRLYAGNRIYFRDFIKGQKLGKEGVCRMYGEDGTFFGLYSFDKEEKSYKCEKMFIDK